MILTYPDYFEEFTCLAGSCPDSCCQEWEVDVDEASAGFYRSLPGDLGDALRRVLRQEDGSWRMTIENRRCPMWRTDGLCRIQAELGHDALCKTCREFPRLTHEYGPITERGLELSCPEAARLIFRGPHKLCRKEIPGGEEAWDPEALDILLQSRDQILDYLNTTPLPLPQALTVLLLYAHKTQAWLDGNVRPEFDPEGYLAFAKDFVQAPELAPIIDFFRELEILTPRWEALLSTAQLRPWEERLKYLAIYTIERYWLQAVSDYDLLGRAKFTLTACILINSLEGDPVANAQLFSKEIENDPDNLDALWDAAYTHPAFTDRNLISILYGI